MSSRQKGSVCWVWGQTCVHGHMEVQVEAVWLHLGGSKGLGVSVQVALSEGVCMILVSIMGGCLESVQAGLAGSGCGPWCRHILFLP